MADLFSKDYLKELLASDGLADAAKKTVEASAETLIERAMDGRDEQTQDRIRAGAAFARDAKDAAGHADLFSAEYLKEIMGSENLLDLISLQDDEPSAADAVLAAGAEKQVGSLSSSEAASTSSPTTASVSAPPPASDPIPAVTATSGLAQEAKRSAPEPYGSAQNVGRGMPADVAAPMPPPSYGAGGYGAGGSNLGGTNAGTTSTGTTSTGNYRPRGSRSDGSHSIGYGTGPYTKKPNFIERIGAKGVILIVIAGFMLLTWIGGAFSSCVSHMGMSSAGSSSSYYPSSSSSSSAYTTRTATPRIIGYGFGGGPGNDIEYISVEDGTALQESLDEGLTSYAPKGLPCVLLKDEQGDYVIASSLVMQFDDTDEPKVKMESPSGSDRWFVGSLELPLEMVSMWYPDRRELPANDWDFKEILAYDQSVEGYMTSNHLSSECMGDICPNSVVTLQKDYRGAWSIQAYCAGPGNAIVDDDVDTVEYDFERGRFVFPRLA